MSTWIKIINRIIPAIRIEIETVDCFGIKVFHAVGREEATGYGVIEAGVEIIEPGGGIEVVASVTEGIHVADEIVSGVFRTVGIQHLVIAPCVVYVFYHKCAAVVKNGNDISKCVLAVEIPFLLR